MKLHFWGTCGSLPAPIEAESIRQKVFAALKAGQNLSWDEDADIWRFIDSELPFAVKGTYGGNTSCIQMSVPGIDDVFMLDAGSGLREFSENFMKSGKANKHRRFHFFMSHLHWDHIQGFPFFAPGYIPGNEIVFHGYHSALEEAIKAQMNTPCFPVPYDSLRADISYQIYEEGQGFAVGPFTVSSIKQNHPGDSYGYRFDYNGKSVVYSTDSEHKEDAYHTDYRFIPFFQDADIVVFDAQYTLHDATFNKVDWGHSSNIMGVELSSRARVKHLVIYHHEPTNTDEDLDEYLVNTRTYSDIFYSETDPKKENPKYPLKISLAYDGLQLSP